MHQRIEPYAWTIILVLVSKISTLRLFEDGETDEGEEICKECVCIKFETLSIRVLAAKTKRANEYVCQDMKTQTGMQIWGVG